jgi:hypothetical protein
MRLRPSKRAVLVTATMAAVTAAAVIAADVVAGGDDARSHRPVRVGPSSVAPTAAAEASRSQALPSAAPNAGATERLTPGPGEAIGGAWPGAATTGVPSGVRLTARGSVKVTRPGTVLNALDVHGEIEVVADNVTIRNSRVVNSGGMWGIIQREGFSGLTVQSSEVHGDGVREMQYGILNQGGMLTVRRADISMITDGIDTGQGLIEDSYLHDPKFFAGAHTDMIVASGGPPPGRSLVIRHNTVINSLDQTSAIALFQDFGVAHDALVTNNLLAGGGYTLYAGAGSRGTPYQMKIIGNSFRRKPFAQGGRFGPVTAWDGSGPGNVWSGNVWEGTHKAVKP